MSEFSGCVGFPADGGLVLDRDRLGLAPTSKSLGSFRRWSDACAAFAHAQRIVTPEDRREDQPQIGPGGLVILFDGSLFDREGLIREYGFSAQLPDSAMAAAWIARHGPESLDRLAGDYALACWDPHQRRLSLAVAPMATRLIYHHQRRGAVWFANTLPGLLRFPGTPRELDTTQLALTLIAQTIDPSATVYRDVRLVTPGKLLTVDTGGSRETVLWRPDLSRRIRFASDDDYVEAARELLERAVKSRLRQEGPVATFLSGGLDSSLIAATAARQLAPASLHAYTAAPPPGYQQAGASRSYVDERHYVEEIAALHPNMSVRVCHSNEPASFESSPSALFLAGGHPYLMVNHLGWFDAAYRAVAEQGHTAVLTGALGNFTLSYSGQRGLWGLVRRGRLDLVATLLPPLIRDSGQTSWSFVRNNVLAPLVPPRLRDRYSARHHGRPAWSHIGAVRLAFANELRLDEQLWEAGRDGLFLHSADSRAMMADFVHARRPRAIEHTIALRAHYGFDSLAPLADRTLVEFCLSIPQEQFLLGGRQRSLARRVAADRLPAPIVNNLQRGQQNPEWYGRLSRQREDFAADLERLQRTPLAAAMLDLPRLKALLDDWPPDEAAALQRRQDYEFLLPRAIQMGRFLRWAEGGNA